MTRAYGFQTRASGIAPKPAPIPDPAAGVPTLDRGGLVIKAPMVQVRSIPGASASKILAKAAEVAIAEKVAAETATPTIPDVMIDQRGASGEIVSEAPPPQQSWLAKNTWVIPAAGAGAVGLGIILLLVLRKKSSSVAGYRRRRRSRR